MEKGLLYKFYKWGGLISDPKKYNNYVIKMVYSSMYNFNEDFMKYP